jgi:universal stress protein E
MEPFRRILVAVDSLEGGEPAELQRGTALAKLYGASLHIVDVLRDLNMAARLLPQWQAEHQQLATEKEAKLAELVRQIRSEQIEVSCELLRGNFSETLIQVVQDRQIDLLIRSAKGAHSNESGSIGATSNQLLRRASCALWLTQGDRGGQCGRVLAAIDATPEDEAHRQLNRIILGRSQELVERQGCSLDIVYVWDIYDAQLLEGRMPQGEFEEMVEQNRLCHLEAYQAALSEFGLKVTDKNVHLLRGAPTQVIPSFCRAQEMDLLVCGTVARTGISGLMIGNTATRMLSKVPCSILALRP